MLLRCTIKVTAIIKPDPHESTVKIMPRYIAMIADQFLNVYSPSPPYDLLPPPHTHTYQWIPNHTWTTPYFNPSTGFKTCFLLPVMISWSASLPVHCPIVCCTFTFFLSSLLFLLCGKQMKNHGLREVSVYWWKGTICARGKFCNSFAVEHVL